MDISTLLRKVGPLLGEEKTRQIWEQLQLSEPKTASLIELQLRNQLSNTTGIQPYSDESPLEPIPIEKSNGLIHLGKVYYGALPLYGFGLRLDELIRHMAIFGRSGAGKTNVAFLILQEVVRLGFPFLVFDWKKNYRDLLHLKSFKDLVVYTVGRDHAPFFFNPLVPPPQVPPREWLKKLIEILQHAYFLGEGVAFVLQEIIDQVYQERNIYEGSQTWPSFSDVLYYLRKRPVKGREASWMESALRAVGVLCFGAMDSVLNSGISLPLILLLKQRAILELDGLTNSDKTFLIEALLLWIHHYQMNQPSREKLRHILLIEEAHHVLLKKKQELTGAESVTDVILREVREFGEAIILLDQLPSLISKPALENTYTTICMNLKEKGDVTAAAKAMLLEPGEARLLGALPVGTGVVKLQGRWPRPFQARFPLFQLQKGTVTDQEVRDRFLENLGVEGVARAMRDGSSSLARVVQEIIPTRRLTIKGKFSPLGQPLSVEGRDLLQDIKDHPIDPVTARYNRLGWTPVQGTGVVKQCLDDGFLASTSIPLPGTHVRFLELTEAGLEAIGLAKQQPERWGGPEHRFWVETTARGLQSQGVQVEKEHPLGEGKTVDLLATIQGRRVGIEIETGKSDWKGNALKCLEADLDHVVLAGTRARIVNQMKSELGDCQENGMLSVMAAWEVVKFLKFAE